MGTGFPRYDEGGRRDELRVVRDFCTDDGKWVGTGSESGTTRGGAGGRGRVRTRPYEGLAEEVGTGSGAVYLGMIRAPLMPRSSRSMLWRSRTVTYRLESQKQRFVTSVPPMA